MMRRNIRLAPVAGLLLLALSCGGGGSALPSGQPLLNPPPALSISPSTLPDGVVGKNYSVTFQASGGTAPYTWSVTAGMLPAGLELNPSTGQLNGTPQAPFSATFSLRARDSTSAPLSVTRLYMLRIFAPLSIVDQGTLPVQLGVSVNVHLSATGGSGNLVWRLAPGASPPPGMTLLTQGIVSGTPTTRGTYSFGVEVVDNGASPSPTATANITIHVMSLITISDTALEGIRGVPFDQTLTATGGSPPYIWSLASGSLPPGLELEAATGRIHGTPTVTGPAVSTIRATDALGDFGSLTSSIRIYAPLEILTTTLGTARAGDAYFRSLALNGGKVPFTWSVTSGSLPPGLQLSSSGQISGTPCCVGTYMFTVQVVDSFAPPQADTRELSLLVEPGTLQITNASRLPWALVGTPYSVELQAANGTPPYSWSFPDSSSLPAWLSLSAGGVLSGTPDEKGSFSFEVRVSDSGSPQKSVTKSFLLDALLEPPGRNDSIANATPLGNGTHRASISPYAEPADATSGNPDRDYFKLTAPAGATVTVETFARRQNPNTPDDPLLGSHSPLDTVIEIVNGNGQRFQTCNDRADDNPGSLPIPADATPDGFDDPCMNDDIQLGTINDSRLEFRVPGAAGTTVTFYVHVFDWSGHARPDMIYDLVISGAN